MGDPVEQHAIQNVVERLDARYPSLGRAHVRAVIDEEVTRLAGNPVREYLPALVEHAADERLRQEADPVAVVDDSGRAAVVADDGDQLDPMEVERRAREQRAGFLFGDLGGGPA
ncbi:hypothetical protein GE115_09835 [Agromyces sp. CFH 90414]|uniref:Uncharacterized protein n=1 Tax=Agromyces agglutinans TaxID=2662258 RepID=A0A6I2F3W3_9MICO|nr:hypothetical protein [Agromyces agglutinans]MRG60165.1 hypothetical protein [Agromyces agglutinans]